MNAELQTRLVELRTTTSRNRQSLAKFQIKVLEIEQRIRSKLLQLAGMREYQKTKFNNHYSSIRVTVNEAEVRNLLANNSTVLPEDGIVVRVGVKDPNTRKVVKTTLYNSNAELIHQEEGVMK